MSEFDVGGVLHGEFGSFSPTSRVEAPQAEVQSVTVESVDDAVREPRPGSLGAVIIGNLRRATPEDIAADKPHGKALSDETVKKIIQDCVVDDYWSQPGMEGA